VGVRCALVYEAIAHVYGNGCAGHLRYQIHEFHQYVGLRGLLRLLYLPDRLSDQAFVRVLAEWVSGLGLGRSTVVADYSAL